MPVKKCSNNGKPGFKFGDSGHCYTYVAGDPASMKEARKKALMQEIAIRASGWSEKIYKENNMQIQLAYDNAAEIKKQHDSMNAWHKSMAESHMRAADWHGSQSEVLSKAMKEVPLDPDKVTTPSLGGAQGAPTGEPASSAPPAKTVPLDPMKKAEFVQILKDHAHVFGDLGAPIEEIAEIILGI